MAGQRTADSIAELDSKQNARHGDGDAGDGPSVACSRPKILAAEYQPLKASGPPGLLPFAHMAADRCPSLR